MESFFRYVSYVDYYKKGEKIRNVGFLRWKLHNNVHRIEIQLKDVYGVQGDFEIKEKSTGKTIGEIQIDKGIGNFMKKFPFMVASGEMYIDTLDDRLYLSDVEGFVIRLEGGGYLSVSINIEQEKRTIKEAGMASENVLIEGIGEKYVGYNCPKEEEKSIESDLGKQVETYIELVPERQFEGTMKPISKRQMERDMELVLKRPMERSMESVLEKQMEGDMESVPKRPMERSTESIPKRPMERDIELIPKRQMERSTELIPKRPMERSIESVSEKQVERDMKSVLERQIEKYKNSDSGNRIEKYIDSVMEERNDRYIGTVPEKQIEKYVDSTSNRKIKIIEPIHEDKWQQLCRKYQQVHPFPNKKIFLSIKPDDFIVLQQGYQKLVHNSFLLHGFYNYGHMILGKLADEEEAPVYIGVPGVYYEREKQAAQMFGFVGFESTEHPVQAGSYGYYMIEVEI